MATAVFGSAKRAAPRLSLSLQELVVKAPKRQRVGD
jgi:hypothetical protein